MTDNGINWMTDGWIKITWKVFRARGFRHCWMFVCGTLCLHATIYFPWFVGQI